jgi:hypothetical protein
MKTICAINCSQITDLNGEVPGKTEKIISISRSRMKRSRSGIQRINRIYYEINDELRKMKA